MNDSFNPPIMQRLGVVVGHGSPGLMGAAHRHEEIELNYVPSGALTYLFGGALETVEEGQLGVFWAAVPHRLISMREDTKFSLLTVPLAWFLGRGFPPALTQRLLRGELVRGEPLADSRDDASFRCWVSDLRDAVHSPEEMAQRERIVLLEVEARLWRLAHALREEAKPSDTGRVADVTEMGAVERMAAFIAAEYQQPLKVEDVARAVGLHPNYAMTLFRRAFGATLLEYLTQTRLSHAQRLLATTDAKVIDIAFASGFNSVSRFYDAFQKAQGRSPRVYRAGLR